MCPIEIETDASGQVPCGGRLPGSIHAVSVSLPTMRDLIGYERGDPEVLAKVTHGYPRFQAHPFVARLKEHLRTRHRLGEGPLFLMPSDRTAREAASLVPGVESKILDLGDVSVLAVAAPEMAVGPVRRFQQHTGAIVSSRRAEDMLIAEGLLDARHPEPSFAGDAGRRIRETLAQAYGAGGPDDILLASTGMGAISGVYRVLGDVQQARGRSTWVRLGWTYLDTMKILEAYPRPGGRNLAVSNLDGLLGVLRGGGEPIAAVLAEVPSNPLLRTPDLVRLRELADAYGFALVIDATLGTPWNIDVLGLSDLVVESLTKYASGHADLMMGAVVLNPRSRFYPDLRAGLDPVTVPPDRRDEARLAHNIANYASRMERVNRNAMRLVSYLESHPSVRRVLWSYSAPTAVNYERVQRAPDSPGGLITLELAVPLGPVYDRLRLPKGPSLGAEFTLVGPYLYHAHFDLVSSPEGRAYLVGQGLDPDLLRISVGVEDPEILIERFDEALRPAS